jgi:solute carrier family 25 protein 39/40
LRAGLKEFSGTSESHATHNLVGGAGAAAIATLLTGPLDTAKTRTQMIHTEGSCDVHSNRSMLRIMKDIYKSEGFTGLWKGNNARMIKVVPASAIMITSYEIGKDIIKTLFELP